MIFGRITCSVSYFFGWIALVAVLADMLTEQNASRMHVSIISGVLSYTPKILPTGSLNLRSQQKRSLLRPHTHAQEP